MALQYYSTTRETALSGAATAGDTTLYLVDGSTFPDPAVPGNGEYTVLVGYGSDREEICTVTAKPGANIITVTRGQDGSAASTKNAGDVVVHGVSARDWSGLVQIAGSTMTGALFLRALAPVTAREAAPKEYVDDAVADRAPTSALADLAPLASPTFTGNVVVPTADATGEAVNKGQMDTAISDAWGAWTAYTPTLGGFTAGSGARVGAYRQVGKTVAFRASFTCAWDSASASAAITLSLPVTAKNASNPGSLWGVFVDSGTAVYQAACGWSTTVAYLYILGANGLWTTPSGTAPFTWTTGDVVYVAGVYEAA